MALPWLGFVDPVIDVTPVTSTDPTASPARPTPPTRTRSGVSAPSVPPQRTADQTEIAQFFANNPVAMYRDARVRATRRRAARPAAHSPACSRGSTPPSPTSVIETLAAEVRGRVLAAVPGDRWPTPTSTRATTLDTSWTPLVPTRPTPTTPAVTPVPRRLSPRSCARRWVTTSRWSSGPGAHTQLRHADRPGARRAQRTHLGWPPLPRRHGRRLLPRPHDGGPGDASASLTGGQGVWSRIRERTPWEELPGAPPL